MFPEQFKCYLSTNVTAKLSLRIILFKSNPPPLLILAHVYIILPIKLDCHLLYQRSVYKTEQLELASDLLSQSIPSDETSLGNLNRQEGTTKPIRHTKKVNVKQTRQHLQCFEVKISLVVSCGLV